MERINFIEKRPFSFSYKKILLCGGAILGLLLFTYGTQRIRIYFIDQNVTRLTEELNVLKAQQEKKLAQIQQGAGSATLVVLRESLEGSPLWSKTLLKVVESMPNDLWLSDVKSYNKDVTKKALILNGQAREAASIASLVEHLSKSGYFQDVFLTSSTVEQAAGEAVYVFSIDVPVRVRKGGRS